MKRLHRGCVRPHRLLKRGPWPGLRDGDLWLRTRREPGITVEAAGAAKLPRGGSRPSICRSLRFVGSSRCSRAAFVLTGSAAAPLWTVPWTGRYNIVRPSNAMSIQSFRVTQVGSDSTHFWEVVVSGLDLSTVVILLLLEQQTRTVSVICQEAKAAGTSAKMVRCHESVGLVPTLRAEGGDRTRAPGVGVRGRRNEDAGQPGHGLELGSHRQWGDAHVEAHQGSSRSPRRPFIGRPGRHPSRAARCRRSISSCISRRSTPRHRPAVRCAKCWGGSPSSNDR